MNQFILYGKNPEYNLIPRLSEQDSGALSELLLLAEQYCFSGNLWHAFLAWLLIQDENPYSLSCERRKKPDTGFNAFAEQDLEKIYELFFTSMPQLPEHFAAPKREDQPAMTGKAASELAQKLESSQNIRQFIQKVTDFYTKKGVGIFSTNRAFSVDGGEPVPVCHLLPITFSDLWGYEVQKRQLIENTEAFLAGKPANNVLLYGDSGAGKSASVKALLNRYAPDGLRVIELYKHQFSALPRLTKTLRNRNYRFLIYMDDLSFEEFETDYKYLKALMEGGLEERPENILIYATSNRRHLIRETNSDRSDSDDRHNSDTVQEKISLSQRFGLSIYYPKPLSREFKEIVLHLANRRGVTLSKEELLRRAQIWEMEHSAISGRSAEQFIEYILGQAAAE